MELALRLGYSTRHISFVETGRAHPGRNLVTDWLHETGAPDSLRSAALLQAGYAHGDKVPSAEPQFWAQESVNQRSLAALLAVHDPFPALILDCEWRIIDANPGFVSLVGTLLPDFAAEHGVGGGTDYIDLLGSSSGLGARLADGGSAMAALLVQLRLEEWANPALKPRVDLFEQRVAHLILDSPPADPADQPLELVFDSERSSLRFYRFQTVFGLPQDITSSYCRAEIWYPTDDITRKCMTKSGPELINE
jgi:hypothetical protein